MSGKNDRRRRRLIVNPTLQSRIIRNISWPPALALAVTAVLLGLFCHRLSEEALVAQVELHNIVPIFLTVIGFLFLAVGYMVFNALKFSHRVAGPVYRINRTFEAVKEGDYTCRANLRQSDFLYEIADGLNDFLDWLEIHPPQADAKEEEGTQETPEPALKG